MENFNQPFQFPFSVTLGQKYILNHGSSSYCYYSCMRYVSGSNITEADIEHNIGVFVIIWHTMFAREETFHSSVLYSYYTFCFILYGILYYIKHHYGILFSRTQRVKNKTKEQLFDSSLLCCGKCESSSTVLADTSFIFVAEFETGCQSSPFRINRTPNGEMG